MPHVPDQEVDPVAFDRALLSHNAPRRPLSEMHLEQFQNLPSITNTEKENQQEVKWAIQAVELLKRLPLSGPDDCTPYQGRVDALSKKSEQDLVRAFRELADHPFNYEWMREVGCFLNALLATRKKGQDGTHKATYLAEGANGVVARGAFPTVYAPLLFPLDRPPPFILKTELEPGDEDDTLNELIVGLYGTNALRKDIPTFMYVYGGYLCGTAEVDQATHSVTLCHEATESLYSMIETIADALTVKDYIARGMCSEHDFVAIVAQIGYALRWGRHVCDFGHNDLSANNVMVRKLSSPVTLAFPDPKGGHAYVVTDLVVTIIDFGRSHIHVPWPSNGPRLASGTETPPTLVLENGRPWLNTGKIWARYGQLPTRANSLFDMVFFLVWTALFTGAAWNLQTLMCTILAPLYGGKVTMAQLRAYYFPDASEWPPVLPYDRDIDPGELIDQFRLAHPHKAFGVLYDTFNAETMPPLFSCGSGGSLCMRSLSDF